MTRTKLKGSRAAQVAWFGNQRSETLIIDMCVSLCARPKLGLGPLQALLYTPGLQGKLVSGAQLRLQTELAEQLPPI